MNRAVSPTGLVHLIGACHRAGAIRPALLPRRAVGPSDGRSEDDEVLIIAHLAKILDLVADVMDAWLRASYGLLLQLLRLSLEDVMGLDVLEGVSIAGSPSKAVLIELSLVQVGDSLARQHSADLGRGLHYLLVLVLKRLVLSGIVVAQLTGIRLLGAAVLGGHSAASALSLRQYDSLLPGVILECDSGRSLRAILQKSVRQLLAVHWSLIICKRPLVLRLCLQIRIVLMVVGGAGRRILEKQPLGVLPEFIRTEVAHRLL